MKAIEILKIELRQAESEERLAKQKAEAIRNAITALSGGVPPSSNGSRQPDQAKETERYTRREEPAKKQVRRHRFGTDILELLSDSKEAVTKAQLLGMLRGIHSSYTVNKYREPIVSAIYNLVYNNKITASGDGEDRLYSLNGTTVVKRSTSNGSVAQPKLKRTQIKYRFGDDIKVVLFTQSAPRSASDISILLETLHSKEVISAHRSDIGKALWALVYNQAVVKTTGDNSTALYALSPKARAMAQVNVPLATREAESPTVKASAYASMA